MSDVPPVMPSRVREAIRDDLAPVRPLLPPWRRLLYAAPLVVGVLLMPAIYFRVRELDTLGVVLGWVPVAIQVVLAFGLLSVALREGIPGWRVSTSAVFAMVLAAYGLQIAVNLLIFNQAPMSFGWDERLRAGLGCLTMETLLSLPILVLAAWLVSRALPHRPLMAGFLAGTGAGVAGEASWRMFCPYSDPAHVMLGHTAGILVLGLMGLMVGFVWSRAEDRQHRS